MDSLAEPRSSVALKAFPDPLKLSAPLCTPHLPGPPYSSGPCVAPHTLSHAFPIHICKLRAQFLPRTHVSRCKASSLFSIQVIGICVAPSLSTGCTLEACFSIFIVLPCTPFLGIERLEEGHVSAAPHRYDHPWYQCLRSFLTPWSCRDDPAMWGRKQG